MSINAKISINTLDDFENQYNLLKNNVLSLIHEDFLKDFIALEELKNSFIVKRKRIIRVKKKREIKKENTINNKCIAAVWKKGEKKRCSNQSMKEYKFCQFHDTTSKRYYGIINE